MKTSSFPNRSFQGGHQTPEAVGIVEWFRVGEYEQVEKALDEMDALSFSHIRTGISWADYHAEGGRQWFDWLVPTICRKMNMLPCFLYTPPSLGIEPKASSPPKNPKDYADFLDVMITRFDGFFDWVELWNEPNNRAEYDFTFDQNWTIFSEMIGKAAYWMRQLGKKTVLGGMSPVDPNWLEIMYQNGVMQYVDAVGFHGFPNVFDPMWQGWAKNAERIRKVIDRYGGSQEIWLTEAGFSTWQHDEQQQLRIFLDALEAPVQRAYWYSLNDLDSGLPTVNGFHIDEREYHFGLIGKHGHKKLLYRLLAAQGIKNIRNSRQLAEPYRASAEPTSRRHALVIGGAGFIGTNLVQKLLHEGAQVTILDNLSRPGVEDNVLWLRRMNTGRLSIEIADIRNEYAVDHLVNAASEVYHLAAQVAVTTSCENPADDFDVNARGTLNILEAVRKSEHAPPLIFTSTNKVYGALEDIPMQTADSRYVPLEKTHAAHGVNEDRPLDFHSPYGCSKGAADSYVLDYVRTYGIKAVVFRMSCIYGRHQCGTEDQGWVAHFLLSALKGEPIVIYGDGLQVRDILFVDDLLKAFDLAIKNMNRLTGQAFNIGGGADNNISLRELIQVAERLQGTEMAVEHGDWRKGDQKYFVADYRKFHAVTGWKPAISARQGVPMLYRWLKEAKPVRNLVRTARQPISWDRLQQTYQKLAN
ncbi:CDP-paratose 2-epimerase [Desulfonatronum thiosulfatophilum]|uniref:CDP-paratose 2-epimerase n=1 Tax=Desulfonatronum thiosulfatophilum TaxID=617002 RepID=A0A1G6BCD8_9BACT|nr:NAD-dependent epimerase/dehydratase family protein [Desulfonatronum thiosulfatophilum]SDB18275.1 CDP-paratose 2-epimerase [Desulfonatronum thiosulfatophilum]